MPAGLEVPQAVQVISTGVYGRVQGWVVGVGYEHARKV
jgi:hypothetical protein